MVGEFVVTRRPPVRPGGAARGAATAGLGEVFARKIDRERAATDFSGSIPALPPCSLAGTAAHGYDGNGGAGR